MIQINGFDNVSYQKLQIEMEARFKSSGKTELELALKLGLKSTATIKNAFKRDNQVVSDEVLSGVLENIGLHGFIVWMNGERYYYTKT